MNREKIILSNLDIEILKFIIEEKSTKEIQDNFYMYCSQWKIHKKRLNNFINKRKYGTFVFIKINNLGKNLLKIWK